MKKLSPSPKENCTKTEESIMLPIQSLSPEQLYALLLDKEFETPPYRKEHLGQGMIVVYDIFGDSKYPRFIIDTTTKRAYEFMTEDYRLTTVQERDINFQSFRLEPGAINVAEGRNVIYPIIIHRFHKGYAMVSWQLSCDESNYVDEDGYGMTNEEEVIVYGFIDKQCRVIFPFTRARNQTEVQQLRIEAAHMIKTNRV